MRCPKCNDVLPIGGKVCKNCNYNLYTQQFESSQPKPVQPVPVKPVQPVPVKPVQPSASPQPALRQNSKKQAPKSKPKAVKWMITVLVALLATGVGRYVGGLVGRSVAENWAKDPASSYSFQEEIEQTINPAFDVFLLDRGLTYTPAITAQDSECFVTDLGDGILEILEFGYTGDVVTEQIDAIYYPISDLSEDDIAIGKANLRETFDAMADNAYTTVSYDRIDGQYIVVQLHFTDLDTQSAIQVMTDAGMIQKDTTTGKYVDYISMSKTTDALLASGFIQR